MNKLIKKFSYQTPIGRLYISENEGKICRVSYSDDILAEVCKTDLIEETNRQISQYFLGERKNFDVPLLVEGTEFQKRVWKFLLTIGYGQTVSYKDVAQMINFPKAYRAVGNANNKNNIMIIIPCHRVVGNNGNLVGYVGGLSIKKYLLDLEQNYINN